MSNQRANQQTPQTDDFLSRFFALKGGQPFRFEAPFEVRRNADTEPLVIGTVGAVTWVDSLSVGVITEDPEGDGMPRPSESSSPHVWPPASSAYARLMLEVALELELAYVGQESLVPKVNASRRTWVSHRDAYWNSMPDIGAQGISLLAPDAEGFAPSQTPPKTCREVKTHKGRAWHSVAGLAWCVQEEQREVAARAKQISQRGHSPKL
jgi:hypothetical protein